MTKVLIDGDIVMYQCVARAEEEFSFDGIEYVIRCDHSQAQDHFRTYLLYIAEKTQADEMFICLSHAQNFRKDIASYYKANRAGTRKPLGYRDFRSWVEETWSDLIRCKPGLEADDVMGILATRDPRQFTIWTEDKDLATIPGSLWLRGEHRYVSLEEADRFHMFQTLTGDSVDNYPGCKAIGEVKANKLLDEADPEDHWEVVEQAFLKADPINGAETALQQARLARILRASDYDFIKQEPILWTPN